MASETYKLTYFNLRGRAEPSRMMFYLADQEFEDHRVPRRDWPSLKPSTPLGYLPILETSSGIISDSVAVDLFVAGKTGFLPEDDFDKAQATSTLVVLSDLCTELQKKILVSEVYKLVPTPEDIEDKKKEVIANLCKTLSWIEGLSKQGAKYIFGNKMSVADINLYTKIELFESALPGEKFGSERIRDLLTSMKSDKKFAEYLEKRPASLLKKLSKTA